MEIESKYLVETRIVLIATGDRGVVIDNIKGDIFVVWSDGKRAHYDEEFLDKYTYIYK